MDIFVRTTTRISSVSNRKSNFAVHELDTADKNLVKNGEIFGHTAHACLCMIYHKGH